MLPSYRNGFPFPTASFDYHLTIRPTYHVFWTINAVNDSITLGVASQSSGYLALGLSENGACV